MCGILYHSHHTRATTLPCPPSGITDSTDSNTTQHGHSALSGNKAQFLLPFINPHYNCHNCAHLFFRQEELPINILFIHNYCGLFQCICILLTTFMMDLSHAIEHCNCCRQSESWAALRTSRSAFLHSSIPGAKFSPSLYDKSKYLQHSLGRQNIHTHAQCKLHYP